LSQNLKAQGKYDRFKQNLVDIYNKYIKEDKILGLSNI